MDKKFYSVDWFKKNQMFIFPIVKNAADYAEITRVGQLEAGFQQVQLIQTF